MRASPRLPAILIASLALALWAAAAHAGGEQELAAGARAFDQRDYATAREHFEKAVAAGNAEAMFRMGVLYERGHGIEQDYAEAARWYRKAADGGVSTAMFNLGVFHEAGRGVPKDDTAALEWYEKAAEARHPTGMRIAGWRRLEGRGVGAPDPATAAKWFRMAAESGNGDGEAASVLGALYMEGRGVEVDIAQGLRWLRRGAARRETRAMVYLAYVYAQGRGVPQDLGEALRWNRKAAILGEPRSMLAVGLAHLGGQGVPVDHAEAARWLRMAFDVGHDAAAQPLARLCYDGLGVARDVDEALTLFERAQKHEPGTYTVIGAFLCELDLGRRDDAAARIRGWKQEGSPEGWEGRLVAFLAGDIDEDTLFAEAAAGDKSAEKLCEAYFYAAMIRHANGDRPGCVELLRRCIDTRIESFVEHRAAKAALERLRPR